MAQSIHWQKSSYSGGADGNSCVELAVMNGEVLMRESDEPSALLSVTQAALAALIRHVREELT
ncbi:DUF397 domain-containing protein [Streptomyces sp. NPDC052236]|uniref:DUF397 domain-containing protein n=1 Tax=Streptomyces sp. NPDC052236 TaxID=3365686 RepID=UPI0037D3BFAB